MWVGKKNSRLKKNVGQANFTCHSRECPDIPWNARPKKSRGGKKKPLRPRPRGTKKLLVGILFTVGGGKKIRLAKSSSFVSWTKKLTIGTTILAFRPRAALGT